MPATDGRNGVILIVEDDPSTRTLIAEGLRRAGHRDVVETPTAEDGEAVLVGDGADILILDLGLPKISGIQLLRKLQGRPHILERLGIVVVTANHDRADRLLCLELGADHFVNKPVQLRELHIHVRNLMKRMRTSEPRPPEPGFGFATFVLWPGDRLIVAADGTAVDLTRAEYELLHYLLRNSTRAFTRDQLLDAISGPDGGPADRAIDNLVRRLRAKLSDDARNPALIKTLHGHGYAMACPVASVDPSMRRSPPANAAPPT